MGRPSQQRMVVAVSSGFDIYHNGVFTGAGAVLAEHDIALVVHQDLESPVMPATLACLMRRPEVCGVILLSPRSPAHEEAINVPLAKSGIPVVRIGQNVAGQACVRADNAQGMTELMRLVLDRCGARKPGFVRWPGRQPDHVRREEIFRAEIIRRGLQISEARFAEGAADHSSFRPATLELLQRCPDIDAVVTMHDWCALFAIEACQEAGKRVPEDIVVTGFDNYPMLSITWPDITTVDQNLQEQGAAAARMIIKSLAGAHVREHVLTRCDVIPRGSTAVAEAHHDTVVRQVDHVARLASAHMRSQDELERMGHALMRCQSFDDLHEALPAGLAALGVPRAFLVVYEGAADPPQDHGVLHHVARLVLDYRDGRVHPESTDVFSSCDLLPERLHDELYRGRWAMVPLEGSGIPLGHLLLDLPMGPVPIVTDVEFVLSRALEVIASIRALSEHSATLERLVAERSRELMAEIDVRRRAEDELRRANSDLQHIEITDVLTQVGNRQALERHFSQYWQRNIDDRRPLAVFLVDIDHFKAYNDRYGHLLGDEALRTVATCLRRSARYPADLVCRFGGEEFIVVLPGSGQSQAVRVARRFARALAEAAIPHETSPVASTVTTSIGVAAIIPTASDTPKQLIALADKALYQAKRDGRNRMVTATRQGPLTRAA